MPLPALLVSVRNLADARKALAGGCDRLDVKEPLKGPLGMADPAVIADVAAFCMAAASHVRVSAALGEIHEFQPVDSPFVLPRGVSDIKFGPARLNTAHSWVEGWRRAVAPLDCGKDRPAGDGVKGRSARVAVAYADWRAARSLEPHVLLGRAIEVGADGFLIDTYGKGAGSLLDLISTAELGRIARDARRAGMTIALAGSLRLEHLAALVDVRPDIIAVRGAACERGDRSASVSADCVGRLKAAISELF